MRSLLCPLCSCPVHVNALFSLHLRNLIEPLQRFQSAITKFSTKVPVSFYKQGSESKQYNPQWLLMYYNVSLSHKKVLCNQTSPKCILDTCIYKGDRFKKESILDIKTHFKPTETFQYTHFYSCHPSGVKKGFIKGEALRLLRTNSSKTTFELSLFKQKLRAGGYPDNLIDKALSEVKYHERMSALKTKKENEQENITVCNRIPPFCAKFENHFNKQMVSYRKAIIIERNIQGTSHNLL